MCDWSPSYGFEVSIDFEGLRRARKHMTCGECGGRIVKRSRYRSIEGEDEEGDLFSFIMCKACARIADEFTVAHGDPPGFGQLDESLEECIELESREVGGHDEEESGEAKYNIARWERALGAMYERKKAASPASTKGGEAK